MPAVVGEEPRAAGLFFLMVTVMKILLSNTRPGLLSICNNSV